MLDAVLAQHGVEAVIDIGLPGRDPVLVGKGFRRAHGRQCVRHVEHRGDAAERRGRRAAGKIFLLGIAGIAKMHVNVDCAGQDMQPGRIQPLAARRHRLRRADGMDHGRP